MTLRQQRQELAAEVQSLEVAEVVESLRRLQLAAMEQLLCVMEPALPKRSINPLALLRLLD